jgi:acyl-CoA thioesterase-1
MNPVVFHIASGQAFFTGIVVLSLAAVASNFAKPWIRRVVPLATVVRNLAVVLSSTPISVWSY